MDVNYWRGMLEGEGVQSRGGIKGRKKLDNYNSIMNKIYFLKKNLF